MKAKIYKQWIDSLDPDTEIAFAIDSWNHPASYYDLNTVDKDNHGNLVMSLGRPWPRKS